MSESLLNALRRSVEARNNDPARLQAWLDDWSDRGERSEDDGEDDDQGDPV